LSATGISLPGKEGSIRQAHVGLRQKQADTSALGRAGRLQGKNPLSCIQVQILSLYQRFSGVLAIRLNLQQGSCLREVPLAAIDKIPALDPEDDVCDSTD
jgi:hypothetical protein